MRRKYKYKIATTKRVLTMTECEDSGTIITADVQSGRTVKTKQFGHNVNLTMEGL